MPRRFFFACPGLVGLALVILLPRPASAAWPTDPLINVPICTAANGQFNPTIVTDGAGGAIITWYDNRSGSNSDIYAQRVLAGGAVDPAWPADGRALCTAGSSAQNPTIVTDGAGGAIVTWFDYRSGDWDIYAQHVLASGAVDPAWPAAGRALCTAPDLQNNTAIIADGAGGAIVTWQDYRNGSNFDIYAQRVLASGAVDPAWPVDGRSLCTAVQDQAISTIIAIIADGAGGAIVTWQDYRSGASFDIYAHHVLASGAVDPAWPADGRALCTDANWQGYPTIVADGAGGAIITWYDNRSGSNSDIYAQRVLAGGAVDPAWPADGRALCTAGSSAQNPTIVTDGAGGAIVTWFDYRSGDWDIYAQHVLANGTVDPAWPADGRALCTAAGHQNNPGIVSDGSGGAIVTWTDQRTGDPDIYAQRVLANGGVDPSWPADGRALCTAAGQQNNPGIVTDGAGGAIVTWPDNRTGDLDIYAQRVLANGHLGDDIPTATLTSLASIDARPDRVQLTWYSTGNPVRPATVYRRTGDTDWAPLGQIAPDGSGYLRYEDAEVTSGTRYGYRLGIMDEGQEVFAGEVWVEVPQLRLALRGATPNPAVGGRLQVEFTLGGQGPARIDMIDVAGRVVRTAEVSSLGPGTHSFEMSGDSPLRPGIYFLRLRQSGAEVRARIAVVD